MAKGTRRPVADPVITGDLDAVEIDEVDDDAELDGVAIGAGVAIGRTIRGLVLERATVTGVRLAGATLERPELVDVVFEDCDLAGATFSEATMRRVAFRRCRLSGVVAADLVATDLAVSDCRADEIWLRASRLDRCALSDCDLTGSDWYGARVASSRIVRCDLAGAELSAVELDDVALHGTELRGVHGLASLRNIVIDSSQLVDLAVPVLSALGIHVDDDPETDGPSAGA